MKKTISFRYLLRLTAVLAVMGLAVHFLHARQASKQAQAFLQLADDAQRKGELSRAIDYLSRYLVLEPGDTDARLRMGFAMARAAKRPDEKLEAFFVLEHGLREAPKREDVRRRIITLAMDPNLGLYSDALGHLEVLKAIHPDDGELCYLVGQCQTALGDFEAAKISFTEAIALKPTAFLAYARQATILRLRLNKREEADQVIEALLAANPEAAGAHLMAAGYWREFGNLDKAEAAVARSLELAPHDAEALLMAARLARVRGEMLRQKLQADQSKQETEKARGFLQLGIDKNPPPETAPALAESEQDEIAGKRAITAELYRNLVELEVSAGRLPEAEKLVRRGVEILPEQWELAVSLADVLIRRNQMDEATDTLKTLQDAGYPVAVLDYHRARILASRNRWLEASLLLERAVLELVVYPAFSRQAYFLLGECYDQMGEIDLRYEAFVRSRPIDHFDPLWAPASVGLAASMAEMGRTKEAIDMYRTVATFYPGAAIPLARVLFVETIRQPRDKRNWTEVERALKIAPDSLDKVLLSADVLQARGLPADARQTLEKAKEKYSGEIALWVAFAVQAFFQKNEPKAQDFLKDAETKFGDRVEIRLARSRFLSAPLTPEGAKQLTRLAEGIDRFATADRRRLLRGLSDRAQELGAKDLASALWDQLAVEQPDNLGVHYRRFDHAVQANDEPAIVRVYGDIRRIDGSGGTSTRMARSLYLIWKARHGDASGLDEARNHLFELEQKRPGWSRLPLGLALVYELKGDIDSAIPKYRQAVDLGERDPEVIKRLIELYYLRQNFNEAEAILRNAPESLAGKEGMPFLVAEIALGTGNYARALEMAEKTVAADNKDYRKHLWLGRIRWLSGKRAEAETPFRKAVELEGSAPETWITLIQYLADRDRKPEAEKLFVEAQKRIKPEEAALTLAQGYEILGRTEEAQKWYEQALKERPEHVAVLRNAANFRLRHARTEKDLDQVRELLEGILRLQAKSREDTDFARRLLAIVLALSPDYQKSRRALEILGLLDEALSTPTVTASVEELRARAVVLSLQSGRRPRQESVKLFETIESRRPLSSDDQFLMAQIYNTLGDQDKAQHRLARLVSARGDNPLYVASYVRFLILNNGSMMEAQKWLAVLEKMQPDAMRTAELRARLLVAENQKKQAAAGLLAFVNKRKEMAFPVARLLESLKDFDQAEFLYKQAMADSKQPASNLALAGFYGRWNRNRQALDILEQNAKACTPQSLVQTALGVLYTLDQPLPEDVRRVRALLEKYMPKGADLRMEEAALRNLEGNYDGAASAYREIFERDPTNHLAINNFAFLLAYHEHKHSEALELIRKVKSLSKPLAAVLLHTEAVIHISAGNPELAIELLQDVITDRPTATAYFHLAQAYSMANKKLDAADALVRAKKMGLRPSDVHQLELPSYRELLKEFP